MGRRWTRMHLIRTNEMSMTILILSFSWSEIIQAYRNNTLGPISSDRTISRRTTRVCHTSLSCSSNSTSSKPRDSEGQRVAIWSSFRWRSSNKISTCGREPATRSRSSQSKTLRGKPFRRVRSPPAIWSQSTIWWVAKSRRTTTRNPALSISVRSCLRRLIQFNK